LRQVALDERSISVLVAVSIRNSRNSHLASASSKQHKSPRMWTPTLLIYIVSVNNTPEVAKKLVATLIQVGK
jgi:hypothetical protein